MSIALLICAFIAKRSKKPMGTDVFLLLIALLPPVVGNCIVIGSTEQMYSELGFNLYNIGLAFTVLALLRFTTDYCGLEYQGTGTQKLAIAIVGVDMVQLLANGITGHAFTISQIIVEGAPYYAMTPLSGEYFHWAVVFGVFIGALIIFIRNTVTAPLIYLEKYAVILAVMVFTGAWEGFYLLSGTPVDSSMLGFAVFGLLIFYFALYYRPMRLLERMLARIVSSMSEAVLFFDREGNCIYSNAQANELFDIKSDEDLKRCPQLVKDAVGEAVFDLDREWTANCAIGKGDDKQFWNFHCHTMDDKKQQQMGAFISIHNRTDEEVRLRREKFLANHDRLTGVYNKDYLYEVIRTVIDTVPDTPCCIIGIDVKDFKLMNDIYSKETGDDLLCAIAGRMRSFATPHQIFGRLVGDRFGMMMPTDELDEAKLEAQLCNGDFRDIGIKQPVFIQLGIYKVAEPELPVSVMFDRSFMAIATIKNDYQSHIAYYDDTMRDGVIWNQQISGELDEAIAEQQIIPYLQPMVNDEGVMEGAEVLVRWKHPEEGFLAPYRFIPYFEENGRIAELDAYMWECACRILKDWKARGIDLFLSVNISPKDFYFLDVNETIANLVKKYDVEPRKLRLEITEAVMMNDVENRLRIIENFRSMGFLVEMDDFGSGYSSLNMLKDIPVDILKIDMMFLLFGAKDRQRAQTILQTIIDLSEQLGIPSVTEGVETVEQRDMLVDMGCHLFQGYYFAKPMPLEEFEEFYQKTLENPDAFKPKLQQAAIDPAKAMSKAMTGGTATPAASAAASAAAAKPAPKREKPIEVTPETPGESEAPGTAK